jgi:hypothetical protein
MTCATASRRRRSPLVGLRGDPGTQHRLRLGRALGCARPARRFDALRVRRSGAPEPVLPGRGPPIRFRSPSEARHRTPAPSRRANRLGGRCFLSWAFSPYDTCGTADPLGMAGSPAPDRVPRPRFLHLLRGVHHRPSRRPKAPERPWASPFKAFSSRPMGAPLGVPALVPFPASVRRSPWGADGRGRLQGLVPGASSFAARPCGRERRCLPGVSPSRAFALSVPAIALVRAASPFARRGVTFTTARALGCSGTERSAGPSRDCRPSWGFPPCDRRGAA